MLVNLGTPDAPQTKEVRRYLREFLNDPRVIDIAPLARKALLNLIVLPTRPSKSAEAYREVWTERGSPLLFHSQDLTEKVAAILGDDWHVELAMRYGSPSIEQAFAKFRDAGIDNITLFPLYPQYASSSTGSSVARVYELASKQWNVPNISVAPAFYEHPLFIDAWSVHAKPLLDEFAPDHILFSYHGLPERHMRKSDESAIQIEKRSHCLQSKNCCDSITKDNRNCYRAQCFATTRAMAKAMDLAESDFTVCFQSRLTNKWIEPFTDKVLEDVAKKHKRVAVLCPAFVADCLETIEEIGMRGLEQFQEAGGKELVLIPSLNSNDAWAKTVAELSVTASAVSK